MNTVNEKKRYMEWKSADEMHETSLNWISKLRFIKDEHKFYKGFLKDYTLPVVQSNQLGKVTALVALLMDSEKQQEEYLQRVKEHRNGLQVMIDGLDQITEENRYRIEHINLTKDLAAYGREFRSLKKSIFRVISAALKLQKQKRLIN